MKAESCFSNFWLGMAKIKNELGYSGDRIITLGVPQEWVMEFSLER